ncbi:MAG: iron hydrogenase [Candidatus Paceibacterota bacterium]
MKYNIKALALSRETVLVAVFVGMAMIAPLIHSQLVTGTIVNAALFGAVVLVGFRAACAVAVIPSLIALAVGILPVLMLPMVPFIVAGNIALAGTFALLRKTNFVIAMGVAAIAKFGFLVLSANVILMAITHGKMSVALASMMGWPQLITALLGAALAYMLFERNLVRK